MSKDDSSKNQICQCLLTYDADNATTKKAEDIANQVVELSL
jgi:hypothetical protein